MKDEMKTKEQLAKELSIPRRATDELKRPDGEQIRAEEEQRQNRETAERLAEEIGVIAEIGRLIGSTLDIEEVYERFAAEAKKLIPFDRLVVNLNRPQEGDRRCAYVFGVDIPGRRPGNFNALPGSLDDVLLRTRSGIIVQAASIEEMTARVTGVGTVLQAGAGLRSLMGVPLIYRDEVIGGLHFSSKKLDAYTEKDLRLAERIGSQIAGAIASAQLYKDLKETEASLRESEARFRVLFEQASVGVAEIEMVTSRYLTVNWRLCEITGRTEEEMLSTNVLAITHPDDVHLHEDKSVLLTAGKIGRYDLEMRYIRKDGTIIWVDITVSPLWKPGKAPERNIVVVQDITDRKRAEEENERHSRQLAALHESSIDLTAELNLNALLQSVAQRALDLIGGTSCNCFLYRPETGLLERVAKAGQQLVPSRTTYQRGEGFIGHIWETGAPLLVDDYHSWPGRVRENDPYPSRALVGVPVHWGKEFLGVLSISVPSLHKYTQADVEVLDMFATQAAIAIRNARLYGTIEQLAITDELTGLFNRRGFFQFGEREFERALRFSRPLTALMFDIDHFKKVNDTHGHPAGDQVLRALAGCFRQNTRGIDVAGRYGGEEFILLLPEIFLPEVIQITERLRQSIAGLSIPICPATGGSVMVDVQITVSIGVAVMLPGIQNLTVLVERADQALYRAKDSGRNRVVVWEETPDS